jgi:5-methylcytosine-specific restriction endonuclease McrA
MARPSGDKTRCGGRWTEAKWKSFIKNQLRSATRKWAPISDCLKDARVERGLYLCSECKEHVPTTVKNGARRTKNVLVDHIEPIVPVTGWVSWDSCIERMFCEVDNLQLLCKACHDIKSKEETGERAIHRAAAKAKENKV